MKKSPSKKQSEIEALNKEIKRTMTAIEITEDGTMIPILERLLREQKYVLKELEKTE